MTIIYAIGCFAVLSHRHVFGMILIAFAASSDSLRLFLLDLVVEADAL